MKATAESSAFRQRRPGATRRARGRESRKSQPAEAATRLPAHTGRTPIRSASFTSKYAVRRETAMAIQVSAEIASVYRLLDGSLHHARCGHRLMVQGRNTEELHCYCLTCVESVWLPLCALVGPPGADGTIGPSWD